MKTELKPVIIIEGNLTHSHKWRLTHSNYETLSASVKSILANIGKEMHRHPIISLRRVLIGEIDGFSLNQKSDRGIAFYVSDTFKRIGDKNYVCNMLNGQRINIADSYVVINRHGMQLYPPVPQGQQNALQKFASDTFKTVYTIEKTR